MSNLYPAAAVLMMLTLPGT